MTVFPAHPEVEDFLTLKYRQMVKVGRTTRFDNLEEPMYSLTSVRSDPNSDLRQAALFSHQGFWRSLKEHLEKLGYEVDVQDVRPKVLDYPNFAAALQCLRSYQRPWIIEALKNGNSGLIGAPTRFGKTYGMEALCRAFSQAVTVIAAPGVDLCRQLLEHFKQAFPHRDVRGVFSGSRSSIQSDDITICSIDSLDKMNPDTTELLIIDEPHAAVSDERLPKVASFVRARKYGFGATLKGRFDQKDRLIEGLIGPVISNVTYREGVEMGAISPLKVIFIKIPFSKDTIPGNYVDRDVVYQRLLTLSSRTAALVKKLMDDVIPQDWQTMAFIQNEKQAEFFMEHAMPPTGTIAMAKRMKPKERKMVTDGIVSNEIVRVLASNIYVQGLTFPDLRVVMNLAGGGANTTAIQKPGRLLQIRPNKNYGVMIDFMFECRDQQQETRPNPPYRGIVGECWARHKAYTEIGYDIEFVEDSARAREIVLGSYN
jgi:superfamily II DNA or RNA helicase